MILDFSLKKVFSDVYVNRVTPAPENASENTPLFGTIMKTAAMLTNSGRFAYRLSGSSEIAAFIMVVLLLIGHLVMLGWSGVNAFI